MGQEVDCPMHRGMVHFGCDLNITERRQMAIRYKGESSTWNHGNGYSKTTFRQTTATASRTGSGVCVMERHEGPSAYGSTV